MTIQVIISYNKEKQKQNECKVLLLLEKMFYIKR